jgi:hypothetical protein
VHRLADDVLPQHRADRGQAVAAARERGAPGPLEVQVPQPSGGVDQLPEQQRAAVAEAWDVPAELVPGVALRHRPGTLRHGRAHQETHALVGAQPRRVEPEFRGQPLVEHEQSRVGGLLGPPGHGQLRELAGEAVGQDDGRCRCDGHLVEGTEDGAARSGESGERSRARRAGREAGAGEPFAG